MMVSYQNFLKSKKFLRCGNFGGISGFNSGNRTGLCFFNYVGKGSNCKFYTACWSIVKVAGSIYVLFDVILEEGPVCLFDVFKFPTGNFDRSAGNSEFDGGMIGNIFL